MAEDDETTYAGTTTSTLFLWPPLLCRPNPQLGAAPSGSKLRAPTVIVTAAPALSTAGAAESVAGGAVSSMNAKGSAPPNSVPSVEIAISAVAGREFAELRGTEQTTDAGAEKVAPTSTSRATGRSANCSASSKTRSLHVSVGVGARFDAATVTFTASAPPPRCAERGVIAIASGGELGSYSARLGEFGPKLAEEFTEKARRTRVTSGRGDGGVRQRAV